jgi:hypothetical protein
MIRGMMRPQKALIAALTFWLSPPPMAIANAQSLFALQSNPILKVFVYRCPELSASVTQRAESEAARILRPARIEFNWIECSTRVQSVSCRSIQRPPDLIIRFLPRALEQASPAALGIAGSSTDYATAFIFCDRILARRTHTQLLPVMLGRVLAHEITHLLLPHEAHVDFGLMRGQWSTDDLRISSSASQGLSSRWLQFMHGQALRRLETADGALQK